MTTEAQAAQRARGYTRALKNARYLKKMAPDAFGKDENAEGFGTGIPLDILRNLHRIEHHSPLLKRHPAAADALKKHRPPAPLAGVQDPLFSGTIFFAQVTFQTHGGPRVMATSDMQMIVQYARHAIVPISQYAAAQYGKNKVAIATNILTHSVNVPSGRFTDSQLQGWVKAIASKNHLPPDSCIFVVCPHGITAHDIGDNAGYHSLANIPYIVAGVSATGLTLKDDADGYAMVISHEMAEMVVDPKVDEKNPEVCDPCDLNCNNLTRIYFDASDRFLGFNQASPPGGFGFAYYICAIVKLDGAANCPASKTDCQYAPVVTGGVA